MNTIDQGVVPPDDAQAITAALFEIFAVYGSGARWGVSRNGLLLLVTWLAELINQEIMSGELPPTAADMGIPNYSTHGGA